MKFARFGLLYQWSDPDFAAIFPPIQHYPVARPCTASDAIWRATVTHAKLEAAMNIDERLDRLTDRHQALAESLEILTHDVRELRATVEIDAQNIRKLHATVELDAQNTRALARIAEIHGHRPSDLEGSPSA